MSADETLLHHPTLKCKLRGRIHVTTVQYRNLKYASIPGRWQDSILHDALETNNDTGTYDATQFGPSCPQKRGAQAWDLNLVGNNTLAVENGQGETESMDEFSCLQVNVTVPRLNERQRTESPLLPVFVWVHGGGLSMGANSWPQYDLEKFVAHSVEIGRPVIGVGINYRVGILGFLASEELGARGNYGYKDQVAAFRWIKAHIKGFGGDPNDVTAAGESAGGISLSTLLCAEVGDEGLFDRVIIMSGEATLRKPRNRTWHEEMYKDQLKLLGLEGARREDRVKTLKDWDAEDLCQKLPLAQHFCAFVDEKWLKDDVTLGVLCDEETDVHKRTWCKQRVIGDTAHDGTILKARIIDDPNSLLRLHALCNKYLTKSETKTLLTAYNLPASLTSTASHQEHTPSLLALASDLRFYLPSIIVHDGWSASKIPRTSSHRYHFHIPNPFSGSYSGLSSHELDVAYLLQNWNDAFDEHNRRLAKEMATTFIGFVRGEGFGRSEIEPNKEAVTVFTGSGVKAVMHHMYDTEWRRGRGKILKRIGVETLWKLVEEWQTVRAETVEDKISAEKARL